MAKKKKPPLKYKSCGHDVGEGHVHCSEHQDAIAKQSLNLCTVCNKYFDTKEEPASHSHKEAA